MNWLQEIQLDYGHVIRPLIVGTLVAIVCSVVGCFIVLRRMSFLADAIAHSMLAGVIAGYLIMKVLFGREAEIGAMLVGAILAGVVTVAMVGFVTRFSRLKQDTAIGIMYTGIFAIGAFVISIKSFGQHIHIDIYHYIVGSVLSVTNGEIWLLAIVTSIVLGVVIMFYRVLQLTSFDPIMAASIGIPVLAVEYLLTACTSLVVVSGVQIAGVILVVALIVTPAATAYLLSDRLDRMIVLSAIIGVIGFWLGFLLATLVGGSPGPAVVVTMTAIFLLSLVFAPRYGLLADWIRKRNSVPQEIMEDVLGSVLRSKGRTATINEVLKNIANPNPKIRKAISSLGRQGLLEVDGNRLTLTDDGAFEANRLVRAHRLWEAYLDNTSMPKQEIHDKAHVLEHISDQATVDYLDDKLGHPLTDPHGSLIPEDAALNANRDVIVSLLREGHRAEIRQIDVAAQSLGLTVGALVTVGKRSTDGNTWRLVKEDGSKIELNHEQADGIWVRIKQDQTQDSVSV
jgi:manganese/iron transport system permease protein/iron/zinc/copper transport system permease protein